MINNTFCRRLKCHMLKLNDCYLAMLKEGRPFLRHCCAYPFDRSGHRVIRYNPCFYLFEDGKVDIRLLEIEKEQLTEVHYGRSELAIIAALIEHQRAENK